MIGKKCLVIQSIIIMLFVMPGMGHSDCSSGNLLFRKATMETDSLKKIDLLERAMHDCPNDMVAMELARSLALVGRYDEAEKIFDQALTFSNTAEKKARVYQEIGRLKIAEGFDMDAVGLLRKSYSLWPNPEVLAYLKKMETRLAEQPVSAATITRGLSARGFGIQPSVNLRINFEVDRFNLSRNGRKQADQLGLALTDPSISGRTFVLIGHTDQQGTAAYNQELSEKRADAVKQYLVKHFDINPASIETEGQGETNPLYPGTTEEELALNRRVEIKIR